MTRSQRNLAIAAVVLLLLVGGGASAGPGSKPKSGPTGGRVRLTRAQLEDLARDVGFPDPAFAANIAMRESGGDPNAILDTRGVPKSKLPPGTTNEHSIGLWQINVLAWPKYSVADLLDPRRNAEAAFEISKKGTDWRPWSTAKGSTPPKPPPSKPPSKPAPLETDDGDFEP